MNQSFCKFGKLLFSQNIHEVGNKTFFFYWCKQSNKFVHAANQIAPLLPSAGRLFVNRYMLPISANLFSKCCNPQH